MNDKIGSARIRIRSEGERHTAGAKPVPALWVAVMCLAIGAAAVAAVVWR